jgi:hypothetical protein
VNGFNEHPRGPENPYHRGGESGFGCIPRKNQVTPGTQPTRELASMPALRAERRARSFTRRLAQTSHYEVKY